MAQWKAQWNQEKGLLVCSYRRVRKASYLLLELLIAISLVSICIVPFIQMLPSQLHKQIAVLERIELERISECTYAEIVKQLYRNEIAWKILSKEAREPPLNETEIILTLGPTFEHRFRKKIYVWTKHKKKGPQGENFHLVGIKVSFFPVPKRGHKKESIDFLYRLPVIEKTHVVETKKNQSA